MVSPKLLSLLPFSTLALASAIAISCDPATPDICPVGFVCDVTDCPSIRVNRSCKGRCVPEKAIPIPDPDPLPPVKPTPSIEPVPEDPIPSPEYPSCGGFRIEPLECEDPDAVCMDDPRREGCGMACDAPGICVVPIFCGGIAGFGCPKGKSCYDDPRDDCDPSTGGADCGGICL